MFYRLGLAMVRRRYLVLALWLAAVAVSLPFVPQVPRALAPGGFSSPDMESQRAIGTLQNGLGASFNSVLVVFVSPTLTVDDPRFAAESDAALAGLNGWPAVARVVPYGLNPAQVSTDRHAAYAVVLLASGPERGSDFVAELRRRLGKPADLRIEVGGSTVFYSDIQRVSESDLRRAELIAFPFALIALVLVFRSVAAATVPAAVGGCSVGVSLALLYLIARATPISVFALNTTTLFGLGLGVDYSLFVVSRFREELARGRDVSDAVGTSLATAGRAVLFSGLAVSIGLLGLSIFPLNMLRSVAIGGVLTVGLAILAALTLLPALLGLVGRRIDALPVRLPWPRRPAGGQPAAVGQGFWHSLATAVMRRPVPVFLGVLAFLLLLGSPYLRVRLAAPDASILPPSVESRAAYDLIASRFDGPATTPIVVAVETPGSPLTPANLDALDEYVRTLQGDPRVERVESIVSLDPRLTLAQYKLVYSQPPDSGDAYFAELRRSLAGPNVTMVQVVSRYPMLDRQSLALVQDIRATPPPPGFRVLVDGGSAGVVDYVNALYLTFPWAVLAVGLATYVALAVLFRSLVLPLKAIVMNLLSIVASYGALVFIFQDGHFSGLLGFQPLGFVEASGPILMFCALFGLSMDYEVFLLARVREAYEQTRDNTRSVALGLERSGRIITSAAAIVILVSFAFASADVVIVKALGVGMALAVLVDATLVRGLLVPATMRLLGDLNWYWPAPLRRYLPFEVFGGLEAPGSGGLRSGVPPVDGTGYGAVARRETERTDDPGQADEASQSVKQGRRR